MEHLRPQDRVRLNKMRRVARLLDDAIRIPGTSLRVGWDGLIGLIPGVGDLLTGIVAVWLIWQAKKLRAPATLLMRMGLNLVIDLAGGALPVAGDAVDFLWRSNKKNLALVEAWLAGQSRKHRSPPTIDI